MKVTVFLCIAATLIFFLSGCGGDSPDIVAMREVTARAPEWMGEAQKYRAEVKGVTKNSCEQVTIVGMAVKPDPNLIIDPLTLQLNRVTYALKPFHITSIADGVFEGRVSQASVNQYIRVNHVIAGSSIQNINVQFERNLVRVTATVPIYGIDFPITTTGYLRNDEGVRLAYEIQTLNVIGVGAPANIATLLKSRLNPMVDLSGLRFKTRIENWVVDAGGITIKGKAFLRRGTE
ncbi:MAG: LmeA family phospholipid-binding protein [bacterium]